MVFGTVKFKILGCALTFFLQSEMRLRYFAWVRPSEHLEKLLYASEIELYAILINNAVVATGKLPFK